jgi:hypothetical protein
MALAIEWDQKPVMPVSTLFRGALSLAAILSGCMLCGCPAEDCHRTGKNTVGGVATATAAPEQCTPEISGAVDDTSGAMYVTVDCNPPRTLDPSQTSSRWFEITLPDPRTLDASSKVTVDESVTYGSSDGTTIGDLYGTASGTLQVLESTGRTAPLPLAVTDDFLLHVVVHLSGTGDGVVMPAPEVDVDVTLRAADLRQPELACVGGD